MMNYRVSLITAAMLVLSASPAWSQDPMVPAMAMEGMEAMPGMDQNKDADAATGKAGDMSNMNNGGGGMGLGSMSMQSGSAPSDARDPHTYSEGADFGPIPRPRMGDEDKFGGLLVDRLEGVRMDGNASTTYDLQAWYGRDYDRAVLKAEGDIDNGKLQDARTDLLWGHTVATYWDTQLGMRYDSGAAPDRSWLAFGIQGLAPYWFEVDATAYVGDSGRTALRLEADYELLLTQKLILQPRIEANVYGKRDAERALGAGLSDLSAGVRLRYEIRREFAPYIGVEWGGKFGATANYARTAGEDTKEARVVAGVRFWY